MIKELMRLLADEAEAVEGYVKVLDMLDNDTTKYAFSEDNIRSVLTEIVNDEYNHIGRLTALVSSLDREAGEKIAKGIEGEE